MILEVLKIASEVGRGVGAGYSDFLKKLVKAIVYPIRALPMDLTHRR